MHVLDLFSGIGGFSLGLERAGMQTAAFCEIDPYCRKVLARHWPGVKIHNDIKQLDGKHYDGAIDLICGGYPCQPFSNAGKQQGENDPRHLWPEMRRIIREARPRWVVAENVRGHVRLGFDTVAAQLEDDGFTVWPFLVPACAVGAPHRRERLWILAHAVRKPSERHRAAGIMAAPPRSCPREAQQRERDGHAVVHRSEALAYPERGRCGGEQNRATGHFGDWQASGWEKGSNRAEYCGPDVADTSSQRPSQPKQAELCGAGRWCQGGATSECGWWSTEPDVGRVAHGVPSRVDRLRALGNAVVPQIPELIGRTILAYEKQLVLAA
jgi:DNA (cytosine-5)-methyltransferase 1